MRECSPITSLPMTASRHQVLGFEGACCGLTGWLRIYSYTLHPDPQSIGITPYWVSFRVLQLNYVWISQDEKSKWERWEERSVCMHRPAQPKSASQNSGDWLHGGITYPLLMDPQQKYISQCPKHSAQWIVEGSVIWLFEDWPINLSLVWFLTPLCHGSIQERAPRPLVKGSVTRELPRVLNHACGSLPSEYWLIFTHTPKNKSKLF